jgi:alkylation response protein AidB-like acyl-CoA dehydrogenase
VWVVSTAFREHCVLLNLAFLTCLLALWPQNGPGYALDIELVNPLSTVDPSGMRPPHHLRCA